MSLLPEVIHRTLSLLVVACSRAHVHRPHLPLPPQIDCCLFVPLASGGGLGASSAPPIQRTHPLPLVVALKMSHRGCGVAATATAISVLASGQVCPSPVRGMCTSGEAPGSGGRAGMMSFGVISVASAMVVIVIWRVARLICCRVYVKYGTEYVGIKVVKPWTIESTKLLDCYVKGWAQMHFYYGSLCPRPPDPGLSVSSPIMH